MTAMTECGCTEICRVDGWADQFTPATRELMVFTKSAKRYFDLDAVRSKDGPGGNPFRRAALNRGHPGHHIDDETIAVHDNPAGAPPLDWWQIPSPKPSPVTEYQGEPMTATFHVGDAIEVMGKLPEKSVDLILTSPPFLALRSYLPADHPDKKLEGGSQSTPGEYIDWLIDVVEACARILVPHGSLCIELGDTYAGSGGAGGDYAENGLREGQPQFRQSADRGWPLAKSLSLIPESFRFAMVYGFNPHTGRTTEPWRLRNVIRWVRPNPPVGALGDKFRPATSELMVFCKSAKRYFDLDAVRMPTETAGGPYRPGRKPIEDHNPSHGWGDAPQSRENPNGAPPLDWWQIPRDEETPYDFFALNPHFEPGWKPEPPPSEGRNIPLLEGEEETRYGPKPPSPKTRGVVKAATADPSVLSSNQSNGPDNPAGAPPLDWWNIPLLEGEEPSRMAPKPAYDSAKRNERNKGANYPSKGFKGVTPTGTHAMPKSSEGNFVSNELGAPPLDWWNIPPGGYVGAHYAVWPPELCVKPVKAMSPEKVCRQCGEPSRRIVESERYWLQTGELITDRILPSGGAIDPSGTGKLLEKGNNAMGRRVLAEAWSDCGHDDWRPGLILDPFAGSGTTLAVATGHGRDAIGIDLDERNYNLALQRVGPFILERAS